MLHFLFCLLWVSGSYGPAQSQPDFKILTSNEGVYKVPYEELLAEGSLNEKINAARIGITNQGQAIPIWVETHGDSYFGPGDWIEFQADILHGEHSYYHEYSDVNVYLLSFNDPKPLRLESEVISQKGSSKRKNPDCYQQALHLEVDTILARYGGKNDGNSELWFWKKISCTDVEAFSLTFDLPDLMQESTRKINLEAAFRGWSTLNRKNRKFDDHKIRVWLNDQNMDAKSWDGTASQLLDWSSLDVSLFRKRKNVLKIQVPTRQEEGQLLADAVLINWVELTYPRSPKVDSRFQNRFLIPMDDVNMETSPAFLKVPAEGVIFYKDNSKRLTIEPNPSGAHWISMDIGKGEAFWAVPLTQFKQADGIIKMNTNDLLQTQIQADYVMISHPSLEKAIQPLAQYHRDHGLNVKVVNVMDIYNSFNYGIFHPIAIKRFLSYAFDKWSKPALRFVLLVGDASWDTKNDQVKDQNYPDWTFGAFQKIRFLKNGSTFYRGQPENNRNLVPTWNFFTNQGHSASDNFFACVDGDDYLPDLAIGRFPVVTPEDVGVIVDKTIHYMESKSVGPWRRKILYITNENKNYQKRTNIISKDLELSGYSPTRVYPTPQEKDNLKNTATILDAINQGQALLYFFGHGGRYIWRTGPPDFKKNHDLFTLDHLDQLKNRDKLSIVMSFTCYSAPFDHPGADSIGEKFLRIPNGAVAFLGASWRNSPFMRMNQIFMEEMVKPGTIGESIARAKRKIRSQMPIEIYNLLGDPAVPIHVPSEFKKTTCNFSPAGKSISLEADLSSNFNQGNLVVDILNEDGEPVYTQTWENIQAPINVSFTVPDSDVSVVKQVVAYFWNEEAGKDAMVIQPVTLMGPKGEK